MKASAAAFLLLASSAAAEVRYASFDAPSLGRDVRYAVDLPATYASGERRYPVVYVLHGLFEGAAYVMSPPIRPKGHQEYLWDAMRNGGIGLLAGGAAMLVASALTGTFARSTETELDDENDPVRRRDLVDRGRALAVTTDIVMSLGAAPVVVGTVLTATGATRMRRAKRDVAVQTSGAGLRLRF